MGVVLKVIRESDILLKVVGNNKLRVEGPLGSVEKEFSGSDIYIKEGEGLYVWSYISYKNILSNLNQMFLGVKNGFFVEMELIGLGYRFILLKNVLMLKLGYSHYIKVEIPLNLKVLGFKNRLVIFGLNIGEVNEFVGVLRMFRKRDIYKGKGLDVLGNEIRLKVGKQR